MLTCTHQDKRILTYTRTGAVVGKAGHKKAVFYFMHKIQKKIIFDWHLQL